VTHYGHACLLVESDRARFVFDPGIFSSGLDEVNDVSAIFVTHQHPDHIEEKLLAQLLSRNPQATLIVDPGSAELGQKLTPRCQIVEPGEQFTLAGTDVVTVGGAHALIHADVPVIPNVGFVLDDGAFYHPGDAFDIPPHEIDVLGLPIAAPWLKASEVVEFLRGLSPRVAIPIHEAVLANPEFQFPLFEALAPRGTAVRPLDRTVPAEV
jgi:L-ascorbate metabolism protein UlaG (beta-lactamase superfamily)